MSGKTDSGSEVIPDETSNMISLHGRHINLFIERGPALGPVLEVTVESVEEAKARLLKKGCRIIKDELDFPRCNVKDPFGASIGVSSIQKGKYGQGHRLIDPLRRTALARPSCRFKWRGDIAR
jgi:hypothetical protein